MKSNSLIKRMFNLMALKLLKKRKEKRKLKYNRCEWHRDKFRCLITYNKQANFYCGYVGIPKGLYMFNKEHIDFLIQEVDVFGGLTYDNFDFYLDKLPNEENMFWVGFDTCYKGYENINFKNIIEEVDKLLNQMVDIILKQDYKFVELNN